MIDLQPRHEHIVTSILQQHVPEAVVYVFGSRVALTAKRLRYRIRHDVRTLSAGRVADWNRAA